MKKYIILLFVLASVGCKKDADNLIGTWKVDKMTGYSTLTSTDVVYITFSSEGKLTMKYNNSNSIRNYEAIGEDLYVSDPSKTHPIKYNCKKKSLVVYYDIISEDPSSGVNATVYLSK